MKKPKDSKKAILETQWTVTLHPLAERELQTIPADMQARFLHIGEMLEELGPQRVGLPHIRPLESKLWEMRMTGRDGIARAVYAAVQGRTLPANPAVRQAYDAQAPEFELARELIAARMKAGLTQGDVAALMGTTQSVVARIESGRGTPSMRTVQRFASAVGARAVVRMEPFAAA
jgi:DNA-binding XRE family transcriptional regulator